MPASSRKRNKGKERKAKQQAKKEESERADAHKLWRGWVKGAECDHGCAVMISDDHPVSSFMDTFHLILRHKRSETSFVIDHVVSQTLGELFKSHIQVWNNESYRRLVLDILVRIGTNALLYEAGSNLPICLAHCIVVLEHYNGSSDDINSVMNSRVVILKRRDLNPRAKSIKRDTLKFFRKRISCKCLKKMHLEARKTMPKTGKCFHCKVQKERVSLSLCSHCMVFQYCSRECQVAAWPDHERHCEILVHHHKLKG